MDLICNFPCLSIVLCILGGIVSSALKGRAAKYLNAVILMAVTVMSAFVFGYTIDTGESFTYVMGRFPAPWGNELRAGVLEGGMALFFCIIMSLCLFGGQDKLREEVEPQKLNLYYILCDLLLSSLLSLVYTNDLFTAYVFVEINTISACGLIMIRQTGRTIEAATRYMIMSLLGSGMLLLGICMLYDMTGHLLMENIHQTLRASVTAGHFHVPLMITIGMMCVGIAIKSALFPFHTWLPDAYGYSTVSSAAILSSLVSKGYIFLLIKLIYRVIGFDVIYASRVTDILFVFGVAGMIIGSLSAIKENDIYRMVAFSSVAQIGYIYMGFGLGTQAAMVASIFHILSHAVTKALLFLSAAGLADASGGSRHFIDLTGSAYRNKIAGIAFGAGALSMVGIPLFSGFISKLLFAEAAVRNSGKMLPAMIALAVSTILNAIYFMKTVIRIYTPVDMRGKTIPFKKHRLFAAAMACFIAINVFLGLCSDWIVDLIQTGLEMFA
ncbi:MAG: sodium:proton antiporter [Clostridium sp.]|nr:sodium:proton antiporter [Clostridium sp.]